MTGNVTMRVGGSSDIDAKVALVRSAAGDRIAELEFNVLVQEVQITDDREQAIDEIARRVDVDPEIVQTAPFVLVGSPAQIVEQLHHARERWGFSYFVTRSRRSHRRTIIESHHNGV